MKKYNIGIVLSGGGARGFAHLGVIQALKEKGIEADVYSGVSAGAIVSAFIADGKSPEETHQLLKDYNLFKYKNIHFSKKGIFSFDGLKEKLKTYITVNDIEKLKKDLYIAVTNLDYGKIEYVNKGDLGLYVMASASIPIIFPPVEINGTHYADGGIINNLPVEPILEKCETIIGININPIHIKNEYNNFFDIGIRVFEMHINASIQKSISLCDYFIEPKGLEKYDLLKNTHADELFELGYKSVKDIEI